MTAVKFLSKLRLEMSIEQQDKKTMTSWWLPTIHICTSRL